MIGDSGEDWKQNIYPASCESATGRGSASAREGTAEVTTSESGFLKNSVPATVSAQQIHGRRGDSQKNFKPKRSATNQPSVAKSPQRRESCRRLSVQGI